MLQSEERKHHIAFLAAYWRKQPKHICVVSPFGCLVLPCYDFGPTILLSKPWFHVRASNWKPLLGALSTVAHGDLARMPFLYSFVWTTWDESLLVVRNLKNMKCLGLNEQPATWFLPKVQVFIESLWKLIHTMQNLKIFRFLTFWLQI